MRALLLLLLACGPSQVPNTETQETHQAVRVDRDGVGLCLPLVHACGCSTACALGLEDLGVGIYRISHTDPDEVSDQGTLSRWCFTPAGRGTLMAEGQDAPPNTECIDAFWAGVVSGRPM